ncbi:flagellar hook-associated protein 3 [Cellulomonas sp. ATA003]|uniref:flagellin N-terminal helical domain-containing protein n=1 Tax=Cellulomonas sp. ATA003 TaxID=3073064 RepID=UPI0028736664|nr:flagellar hook-associated protein 3 [Cellulomonas sp. ATA003]WNB85255.1 flagellar hook-associated protein 3 [Cellulomonas sp. ATA003]
MIGRVTQQTVQRSTLTNMQHNLSAMSDLQSKLSGLKNITKPSDDPSGTAAAMSLRSALRANEQHARNVSDGGGWLTTADSALQSSLGALGQVRDLTVQGASTGVLNKESREALAVEIEGLRDVLLAQANTTYLGRSVFAGTAAGAAVTGPAPKPTGTTPPAAGPAAPAVPGAPIPAPYTFDTFSGAAVERRVDASTTVRVDVDGAKAFGSGETSVFATLDDIAAKLRAGQEVGPSLTALDAHRDDMLEQLTALGARQSQLEAAGARTMETKISLTSQLADIEDVDLPGTIIEVQMQEVAYQAALGAASRVLQPTLMDFLR